MNAISHALARVIVLVNRDAVLKQMAMFCGAGLFVGLLMLTYGLDLSPGFF